MGYFSSLLVPPRSVCGLGKVAALCSEKEIPCHRWSAFQVRYVAVPCSDWYRNGRDTYIASVRCPYPTAARRASRS